MDTLQSKTLEYLANAKRRKFNDWLPSQFDFRDTWFPLSHANHVGKQAIRRIVHNQFIYLWREGERIVAADNHPDITGFRRRPANSFTAGSGLYKAVERYGYIWVWYGNPDNADQALIPHIPFLPKNGMGIPNYMRTTIRFDACSTLSVENLLDLTHADFLHGEVVGGEGEAKTDEAFFESTSETITRTRIVTGKPVSPIMRWVGGVRVKYQDFRSTLHVHLRSNVCIYYPRFDPGFDVPNVQPFVPSGPYSSRVDQIFSLADAPTPFRQLMPKVAFIVGPQDNSVMRPQNPRYINLDTRADLHSRFDAPGNRYRYLMNKLNERQKNSDFSYLSDVDPGANITELLGMNIKR
ncbi:MAG: oxygenase [Colwellia sp.]|nr:MAG: oxygenase [Colwellia sp.]